MRKRVKFLTVIIFIASYLLFQERTPYALHLFTFVMTISSVPNDFLQKSEAGYGKFLANRREKKERTFAFSLRYYLEILIKK